MLTHGAGVYAAPGTTAAFSTGLALPTHVPPKENTHCLQDLDGARRALGQKGGKRGKMVLLLSTASLHSPGDGGNAHRHLPPQPLAYAQRGRDCIRHPKRSSQGRVLQDLRSMSRGEGCCAHSNLGPKRGQACHPLWQGASPGCIPAPLGQRGETMGGAEAS